MENKNCAQRDQKLRVVIKRRRGSSKVDLDFKKCDHKKSERRSKGALTKKNAPRSFENVLHPLILKNATDQN